jgi:hypothetical protein
MTSSTRPRPFEQRIASPRWTVTSDDIAVTADIECGNALGIEATGPRRVSLAPREDDLPREVQRMGPISAYSVCVLAENRGSREAEVELEVRAPAWLIEDGFDYFLRKAYVTASFEDDPPRPALDWELVPSERQRDRDDTALVAAPLEAGQRRVISTTARYPYSTCCERLAQLAASHPSAELVEIGESELGRPIMVLEAGDRSAPRAVFTGTLQPGEPSAWAVIAMAEAALGEDARWLEHGLHEPASFDFEEAAKGEACPRETQALWSYLSSAPPLLYVDFHFLRQPNHDMPKTYFFAPEIYDSALRAERAIALNERLLALSGATHPYGVEVGHELWRGLSSYQAAAALDAVSFLYQYTGTTTSHIGAQTRGPQVMREALEVCRTLS